jgi:hypothetical protein
MAKAKQFAAARLGDDSFLALITDEIKENKDQLKESLGVLYFRMSECAKDMSTSQPCLKWKLLDELSNEFQNQSKVMEIGTLHFLGEREARLNGREVLMLLVPHFYRVGGVGYHILTAPLCKAEVWVHDPSAPFQSAYASDEDAPRRDRMKQPQPKRSKTKPKVEADKEKPAPKGKAKATKKKT